jgi:hypothetical protein
MRRTRRDADYGNQVARRPLDRLKVDEVQYAALFLNQAWYKRTAPVAGTAPRTEIAWSPGWG